MGRVEEPPAGAQVRDPPQGTTRHRQAAGTPPPSRSTGLPLHRPVSTLDARACPLCACVQYGAEVRAVVERRHHDGTYTIVHRDDQNNRIAVRLRRERITLLDPPTPTPPVPSESSDFSTALAGARTGFEWLSRYTHCLALIHPACVCTAGSASKRGAKKKKQSDSEEEDDDDEDDDDEEEEDEEEEDEEGGKGSGDDHDDEDEDEESEEEEEEESEREDTSRRRQVSCQGGVI